MAMFMFKGKIAMFMINIDSFSVTLQEVLPSVFSAQPISLGTKWPGDQHSRFVDLKVRSLPELEGHEWIVLEI